MVCAEIARTTQHGAISGKTQTLKFNRYDILQGNGHISHQMAKQKAIEEYKAFNKNKKTKDIFFIDASKEFEKGKNQNNLTDLQVDKIVTTYKKRKDVEKYAHLASFEEIKENDFNLNIPRYVDTFEEEEPVDILEVMRQLEKDNREIEKLEKEIKEQLRILGVKL